MRMNHVVVFCFALCFVWGFTFSMCFVCFLFCLLLLLIRFLSRSDMVQVTSLWHFVLGGLLQMSYKVDVGDDVWPTWTLANHIISSLALLKTWRGCCTSPFKHFFTYFGGGPLSSRFFEFARSRQSRQSSLNHAVRRGIIQFLHSIANRVAQSHSWLWFWPTWPREPVSGPFCYTPWTLNGVEIMAFSWFFPFGFLRNPLKPHWFMRLQLRRFQISILPVKRCGDSKNRGVSCLNTPELRRLPLLRKIPHKTRCTKDAISHVKTA